MAFNDQEKLQDSMLENISNYYGQFKLKFFKTLRKYV